MSQSSTIVDQVGSHSIHHTYITLTAQSWVCTLRDQGAPGCPRDFPAGVNLVLISIPQKPSDHVNQPQVMISIVISQVRPFTQNFDVWLQGICSYTGTVALH